MEKSSKYEIKPFEMEYGEKVIDLIVDIQRNEFNIPISASDQPDLLDIPKFYQNNCGNFWVASCDNHIVGTIALLDIGDRTAALRKMFVHESFRGKGIGVAKKLLETLLHWSKEKGIQNIFLGTTSKFLAAHRFYEKNGFIEVSLEALPLSFPVMKVDTKFYRYRIA